MRGASGEEGPLHSTGRKPSEAIYTEHSVCMSQIGVMLDEPIIPIDEAALQTVTQ